MTWRTVFNPGTAPVVISDEGHQLGGGDWAPAQTTDATVKAALEGDPPTLIVVDAAVEDGQTPEARAALQQTEKLRARADQLESLDKVAMTKIARANGLIGPDEQPLVGELSTMLVRSDVELKTPTKGSQPAPKQD